MADILKSLNAITDRQRAVIEAQKQASADIEKKRQEASQAETVQPSQTVIQAPTERA